jgi:DNA-directed RNA polymerase subunit H (RpoH/RPB5)
MEYFHEHELKYNVMEHALVPKHIVLRDDEKKDLLER